MKAAPTPNWPARPVGEILPATIPPVRLALPIPEPAAVPATAAQSVADRLVSAGVEGIVNFAPVTITLPDHFRSVGVDLAIELEQLSFSVVNRQQGGSASGE